MCGRGGSAGCGGVRWCDAASARGPSWALQRPKDSSAFTLIPSVPKRKPPNRSGASVRCGGAGRGGAGLPVAWLPRDGTRAATSSQPTSKAPAHTPTATPSWRRRRRRAEADLLTTAVGGGRRLACGCATRRVGATRATQVAGDKHAGGTPRGAPAAWTSWPIVGPGTATELRGACESGSAARVTLKRKPAASQAVPQPR